jgi:hypothetical protein
MSSQRGVMSSKRGVMAVQGGVTGRFRQVWCTVHVVSSIRQPTSSITKERLLKVLA